MNPDQLQLPVLQAYSGGITVNVVCRCLPDPQPHRQSVLSLVVVGIFPSYHRHLRDYQDDCPTSLEPHSPGPPFVSSGLFVVGNIANASLDPSINLKGMCQGMTDKNTVKLPLL